MEAWLIGKMRAGVRTKTTGDRTEPAEDGRGPPIWEPDHREEWRVRPEKEGGRTSETEGAEKGRDKGEGWDSDDGGGDPHRGDTEGCRAANNKKIARARLRAKGLYTRAQEGDGGDTRDRPRDDERQGVEQGKSDRNDGAEAREGEGGEATRESGDGDRDVVEPGAESSGGREAGEPGGDKSGQENVERQVPRVAYDEGSKRLAGYGIRGWADLTHRTGRWLILVTLRLSQQVASPHTL